MYQLRSSFVEVIRRNDTAAVSDSLCQGVGQNDRVTTLRNGLPPLQVAILAHASSVILQLLEAGADVNVTDFRGWTPQHVAAKDGQYQTVELLLHYKSNTSLYTNKGMTPLYIATYYGHADIVQLQLQHKANSHTRCHNGYSLLYLAVYKKYPDIIRIQLHHGIQWQRDVTTTYSALYTAIQQENIPLLLEFLQFRCPIQQCKSNGVSPLYAAVLTQNLPLVQVIVQYQGLTDKTTPMALYACVQKEYTEILQYLLSCSNRVVEMPGSSTSLQYVAAYVGHLNIVKLLLQYNSEMNYKNSKGHSAQHAAVAQGQEQVARYQIANNAGVTILPMPQSSILNYAAKSGNLTLQQWLVEEQHLDIAEPDKYGYTPLFYTVTYNHITLCSYQQACSAPIDVFSQLQSVRHNATSLFELQLAYKANINFTDKSGKSPLWYAVYYNHHPILDLLLAAKADPNCADHTGVTPQALSIYQRKPNVTQALLQNKAQLHTLPITQLHVAVDYQDLDTIRLLLQNKIDHTTQTEQGITTLMLAAQQPNLDILTLLLSHTHE